MVVELIPDKETLNNDTDKGESTKTHTEQTVAQQCEQLDSAEYMAIETEADQPVAYSQKHADPSELEDRHTRTPLLDVEQAQAKIYRAILANEDNICVHHEPITTDFEMETMSILNSKIKTIPQEVQK